MLKVMVILLASTVVLANCGIKGDPLPVTASKE
jgi:predicted small lipoprotein YifL